MKLLHRMILRALPGPFLGWLGTFMFLLLMQFLIRYLPDIAGKGLPVGVIIELVAYNLAYMVVLAVPMSALLASLMIFGRLAESNAYAVIKNSGISLLQLLWPALLAGLVLTGGMTYFNNVILPEANFRARNLWQDIRSKKPGFELQPGVFYEGISNYAIQVQRLPPESNELIDVLIFDYSEGSRRQAIIKARSGHIEPVGQYVDLVLENGEIHRLLPITEPGVQERYERLRFYRYRLRLDLSEFDFERSNPKEGYRSDRTTPTFEMMRLVDSLKTLMAGQQAELRRTMLALATDSSRRPTDRPPPLVHGVGPDTLAPPVARVALDGLNWDEQRQVYEFALDRGRTTQSRIEDLNRTLTWEGQRLNSYRVEVHKKFSIAMACVIFMLIGAPLGLSIRRGGLGTVGALALVIFLFYWITLVQGEKLADRNLLTPWVGMWVANIIMTLVGLWLVLYVALDLRSTPPLRRRLLGWLRRR